MTKTKKILSYFFVTLFINYYAGTTLFSHLHIISGVPVTHSHIHKDSHHDTKSGNHTKESITLISQISHFQYVDFLCNFILKPVQFPLQADKFIETTHWISQIHLENLSLRAPPALA